MTADKDDTILYKWREPLDKWNWQTRFATFSRPHHHTHTHTHLVRAMETYSPDSLYSDGSAFPVYLEGQVLPAIHGHSPWFSLTVAYSERPSTSAVSRSIVHLFLNDGSLQDSQQLIQ